MRDREEIYRDLNLFGGMIYNACCMPIWCFGLEGLFFYSTCPDETEFRMLLEHSGCLEYALSTQRHRDRPVYLSDNIGLIWVADYVWEGENPTLMILLGPVFSSEASLKGIEDSLRNMDFSIQMRNNFIQKLKKVSVLSFTMLEQYAAMLHHIISGEIRVEHECEYQSSFMENPQKCPDIEGKEGKTLPEQRDPDARGAEIGRIMEECIMQAIREGNVNFDLGQVTSKEGHQTSVSCIEPDHFEKGEVNRDEKNTVIVFVALCARAAMDGGLSPRVAKKMQVAYIRQVEQIKSPTDLITLNMSMLADFIQKVHESKLHPAISENIQYCCDYIQRNLQKPFELSDIAHEVGYSEYYLTKKFYREMGTHLTDYIKNARIEMAKILLMTTDRTIQEISDQLCYNTRGYFSKVFKEIVGVTPAAYRERRIGVCH